MLTYYPQINPEWLLFGKGSMLRKGGSPAEAPDHNSAGKEEHVTEQESPAKPLPPVKKPESPVTREAGNKTAGDTFRSPEQVVLLFDDGTFRTYSSQKSDS